MKKLILLLTFCISISLLGREKINISVFYKDKAPSQKVLSKVDSLLEDYKELYQIDYHNMQAEETLLLLEKLGLPQAHFPFAIAFEGKYTAKIDDKIVSFTYLPLFMKGIGKNEGNWSLGDLKKVLENNELLSGKNILPEIGNKDKHNG